MADTVPLDKTEQFFQRIADLQVALQQRAPNYEYLLKVIHTNLKDDPELPHLLSPEQVGIIVAGLSQKKGIILAKAAGKDKTASGKKLKDVSLGDL